MDMHVQGSEKRAGEELVSNEMFGAKAVGPCVFRRSLFSWPFFD
jgi:hypothetical protein